MKKKLLVIGFILAIIISGIFSFFAYRNRIIEEGANELTSVEEDRIIVVEKIPTLFTIYGQKMDFDEAISVKYVETLNNDTLILDKAQFKQQMIIINDLDGKLSITDEEWRLIGTLIDSNENYSLFYLGDKEINRMQELGVITSLQTYQEGDLSVGVVRYEGEKVKVTGTLTASSIDLNISELLIHELVYAIRYGRR